MITKAQGVAIVELYPQVVVIRGNVAYDVDGTEVSYDINSVNTKVTQNEADAIAAAQAAIDAKQAALNKLMALGLTEEEALALGK